MKKIVAFIFAAMMLTSVAIDANSMPASPAEPGQPGQVDPNFAAHKQQILNSIAQRIQRLQALQTCVQNSQNHEAVKACREQIRENIGGPR